MVAIEDRNPKLIPAAASVALHAAVLTLVLTHAAPPARPPMPADIIMTVDTLSAVATPGVETPPPQAPEVSAVSVPDATAPSLEQEAKAATPADVPTSAAAPDAAQAAAVDAATATRADLPPSAAPSPPDAATPAIPTQNAGTSLEDAATAAVPPSAAATPADTAARPAAKASISPAAEPSLARAGSPGTIVPAPVDGTLPVAPVLTATAPAMPSQDSLAGLPEITSAGVSSTSAAVPPDTIAPAASTSLHAGAATVIASMAELADTIPAIAAGGREATAPLTGNRTAATLATDQLSPPTEPPISSLVEAPAETIVAAAAPFDTPATTQPAPVASTGQPEQPNEVSDARPSTAPPTAESMPPPEAVAPSSPAPADSSVPTPAAPAVVAQAPAIQQLASTNAAAAETEALTVPITPSAKAVLSVPSTTLDEAPGQPHPPAPTQTAELQAGPSVAAIQDFVDHYDGGPCFFASVIDARRPKPAIGVLALENTAFHRLDDQFHSSLGVEAEVRAQRIKGPQCPAVDLLRRTGNDALQIEVEKDRLTSGEILAGRIKGFGNSPVGLFSLDEMGAVTDLTRYLVRRLAQRTFAIQVAQELGHGAPPRLLMAFSAEDISQVAFERSLTAVQGNPIGRSAAKLIVVSVLNR